MVPVFVSLFVLSPKATGGKCVWYNMRASRLALPVLPLLCFDALI